MHFDDVFQFSNQSTTQFNLNFIIINLLQSENPSFPLPGARQVFPASKGQVVFTAESASCAILRIDSL